MMDEKDDTLNLTFGAPAENETFGGETPDAAPDFTLTASVPPAPEAAPAAAALPPESAPVAAPAPEAAPAPMPEPVIRSRQPMNRPAGTPPIVAAPEIATAPHPAIHASYGAALRSIREAAQLDYKDVERGTQIAVRYLEAIEAENLDKLPPLVYVIAYIRTLCRFYSVSNADADQLVSKLKEQLEYPCNQELMNSLEVDNSGAEDNEKRLRRMFLTASGIAFGVVVVIALILFLAYRKPAAPAPAVPSAESAEIGGFDAKSIDSLLEPAMPKLVKLPVAE